MKDKKLPCQRACVGSEASLFGVSRIYIYIRTHINISIYIYIYINIYIFIFIIMFIFIFIFIFIFSLICFSKTSICFGIGCIISDRP